MNKVCEDEELVAFGSTVGNVLPRFLRRVYNKNSSELRAKNSPQDCFFNALSSHVALRPPPVAEEGSKSALQNKELKDSAPSCPHNDCILVRTSFDSRIFANAKSG